MIFNATETPLLAVTLFALWTIVLALIVPIWRIALVAAGRARLGDFTPGDAHGSPIYWRINRAHANAAENLAVFGSLGVCGIATGVVDPTFGALCMTAVVARLVQSLIHIASGASFAIALRFVAYAVQAGCFIGIAMLILQRFT